MSVVAVIDSVPVFPLRGLVLLPGQSLPLHIFEPRYRAMTRDALASDNLLVIANLATTESSEPALPVIAGLGEIVEHAQTADGRYYLRVVGLDRVRLTELPFEPPYRRARAEVLESDGAARPETVSLLLTAFARLRDVIETSDTPIAQVADGDAGALADRIASGVLSQVDARQRVLEAIDAETRVRCCTEEVVALEARLCFLRHPPTPDSMN